MIKAPGKTTINCTVNGAPQALQSYPMERLLDVLREQLRLTGTKEGCGEGECGACSVMIDGRIVNSCLVPVAQVEGAEIKTIEGVATGDQLHRMQQAFIECGGAQCGICTPGMVLAAVNLLERTPNPTEDEIRNGLAGNLCRCTGYIKIFESVVKACEHQTKLQESLRYFAYGSNMCTSRLRGRGVPSAKPQSVVALKGYKLRFHKRSTTDSSAKCNAYRTDNPEDHVIGVIFDIDPAEKPELDKAEGLGHGYHEQCSDRLNAYMYVADPDAIDDRLVPYTWYLDFVVGGAREHNLPEEYVQQLLTVKAVIDSDKERERKERSLLPCVKP